MEAKYTVRCLAVALVNAAKFHDKHPDLATYHCNNYEAIAGAFGLTGMWSDGKFNDRFVSENETKLGLSSERAWDADTELHLAADCVRSLVEIKYVSPFSSYIEAPKNIVNLYIKFNKPIDEGISKAEAGLMELLVATLSSALGIPLDRKVSEKDLLENGLDTSLDYPDELDYF